MATLILVLMATKAKEQIYRWATANGPPALRFAASPQGRIVFPRGLEIGTEALKTNAAQGFARLLPLFTESELHLPLMHKISLKGQLRVRKSRAPESAEAAHAAGLAPWPHEPAVLAQRVSTELVKRFTGFTPRRARPKPWADLARGRIRVTINVGSVQLALFTELKEVSMAKSSPAQSSRRMLLRPHLLPSMFVALSLAFSSVACTKAPQKPAASAFKQAKKDDRPASQDELELERRHQAPPPAYGNKVVMAEEESGPTKRF